MPVGPAWLDDKINEGSVVVIDGGTGSGLEARGVPMVKQGWSVMAQLDHPAILRQLHDDYIEAGAEVIIANTFGAGRHLVEPGGLGDRVEEIHRRAVEIALEAADAADHPVAVAGSISNYMADPTDPSWLSRLDETHQEQAGLLQAAGAEIIATEMMEHPVLSESAVRAAVETGLPVWLGISSTMTKRGLMSTYLPEEISMAETLDAALIDGVDAVFVMHTALPDVKPTLDLVRESWDGPVGVYPEAGYFLEPHWQVADLSPDQLVEAALGWVDGGAQLIGGCCGLDTPHIEALKVGLPDRVS